MAWAVLLWVRRGPERCSGSDMPTNDLFGLEASGIPPELAAEYRGLTREQAIQEALLNQALKPLGGARSAGRYMVAPHPLEGIAKIVQAYMSRKGLEDVDKRVVGVGERYQKGQADAAEGFQRTAMGTPERTVNAPTFQGMTGSLDQQDIPTAPETIPAVKGDPRRAVMEAMTNPILNRNPMLPAMAKMVTPDWEVIERYDDKGNKQKVLMNKNEPTQTQPFGGSQKTSLENATSLARLIAERDSLPVGDPRRTTYDNAIRKESETVRQISPTIVMPKTDKVPAGYRQTANGNLEAIPGGPADPKVKGQKPLSATAQKELFEADDVSNSAKSAIDILKSIITPDPKTGKSQNDIAFEGGTADLRRIGMSFVPGQYPGENASVDMQNKVTGQALEQLRAVFGGMPTEGERKILLELQGSINQKTPQRKAIFNRAIALAERRLAINQDKAKRLREGTYFGQGVATNQDEGRWKDIE